MKVLVCILWICVAFCAQVASSASQTQPVSAMGAVGESSSSSRRKRGAPSGLAGLKSAVGSDKPLGVSDGDFVEEAIGFEKYEGADVDFSGNDSNDNGGGVSVDVKTAKSATTSFVAECEMPSKFGKFKMRSYKYTDNSADAARELHCKLEPVAMVHGNVNGQENVLVRVHDQCFTSEVFGSMRCDCREQLNESLKQVGEQQAGVVIYLQQEGRGIGLSNKVAAYGLQDGGMDTVEANIHLGFEEEMREYSAIPAILEDLGIKSVRLLTNNPYKIDQLTKLGVRILERVPLEIPSNEHSLKYLMSKKMRMNHLLKEKFATVRQRGGASEADDISEGGPNANTKTEKTEAITIDPVNIDPTTGLIKGYTSMGRGSVVAAIQAVKEGKVVLVVDDEGRENEGDLIMAGSLATPTAIGFIVRHSSGVLCASMEGPRLLELGLPPMVVNNEDPKGTAYAISCDYITGISTGISASDRATTFRGLADPNAVPGDFTRPGHVFPLSYSRGGTIARAGHTEASVDLCKLAGLPACGVLAEVVHDEGGVQRLPDLEIMANDKGLVLTSIQDIVAYRAEIEGVQYD